MILARNDACPLSLEIDAARVRIYSDSMNHVPQMGGREAIARFTNPVDEFAVFLKGAAEHALAKSFKEMNEIFGLEMFAMEPAVVALAEQLRGKILALFMDTGGHPGYSYGVIQGTGGTAGHRGVEATGRATCVRC